MNHSLHSGWPALKVADWEETRTTVHMWTQIIGKIRMAYAPLVNHWWQVALYVTPAGLSTSAIPFEDGSFDIEFDFLAHEIHFRRSNGKRAHFALQSMSVAAFYRLVAEAMEAIEVPFDIRPIPTEVDPAPDFRTNETDAAYDKSAIEAFFHQLVQANNLIGEFRADYIGKVSPVHFFFGSFDLACTRFSGELAPRHPGGAPNCGDWVMVEGYSHELSSCGFWPGGGDEGAFYAYAYPVPEGFERAAIAPEGAYYSEEFQQFLLPYGVVRQSADPRAAVLAFLQSTYEAGATLLKWPRTQLECDDSRLEAYKNGRTPRDLHS
ncbi:DUF5996 family protein [Corynebacterium sp. ES2730-CONJ]|uniref:DUF5996 family protein n=1 Tax=Corynebacterium sp. ES2730-CONJ TaxID=2973941 RepID=UPI00216ACA59|nr:DUF5996 family protein [Corynebacterium sp. ES2730-CONJ]MCS4531564.1 DUF5996 family protein [Corynebacterium sp. ES2730-CONJ]